MSEEDISVTRMPLVSQKYVHKQNFQPIGVSPVFGKAASIYPSVPNRFKSV